MQRELRHLAASVLDIAHYELMVLFFIIPLWVSNPVLLTMTYCTLLVVLVSWLIFAACPLTLLCAWLREESYNGSDGAFLVPDSATGPAAILVATLASVAAIRCFP